MGKNQKEIERKILKLFDSQRVEKKYVDYIVSSINKSENMSATAQGTIVHVVGQSEVVLNSYSHIKFVDLKPFFQQSSKVRYKKDGGWYLIIPIGERAKTLKKIDWRTYGDISHSDFGTTEDFGDVDKFQEMLSSEQENGSVNPFRYKWKSNSATRVDSSQFAPKQKAGYISFRTVSDTSDPRSWYVKQTVEDITVTQDPRKSLLGQLSSLLNNSLENFSI